MKRTRLLTVIVAALLAWQASPSQEAQAQDVPQSLTHQGRLVDGEGQPISGSVTLTYTLYDAASAGAILWQSEVAAELSESGFYSVVLGGAENPITALDLSEGHVWMGVTVNGGNELQPRIALNSVPFALRAQSAVSADSALTAASATTAAMAQSVAEGSITAASLAEDFALSPEQVTSITGTTLGGLSCASGQVAAFDGTNWNCNDLFTGVSAGTGIAVSGSATQPEISVRYGTAAGTAASGNDPRLSDARTPTAGSTHYIQNQGASMQNASFRISGAGSIGGNASVGGNANIVGDATVGGQLRTPTWPVAVGYTKANRSAGQKLEYETILVNNGGHYDPVTHFFTAPVTGLYEMCASLYRTGTSATFLNTEVEGTSIFPGEPWGWLRAHDSNGRQSTGCITFRASEGNRIGNYIENNGANCSSHYCYFSIKLVTAL